MVIMVTWKILKTDLKVPQMDHHLLQAKTQGEEWKNEISLA